MPLASLQRKGSYPSFLGDSELERRDFGRELGGIADVYVRTSKAERNLKVSRTESVGKGQKKKWPRRDSGRAVERT